MICFGLSLQPNSVHKKSLGVCENVWITFSGLMVRFTSFFFGDLAVEFKWELLNLSWVGVISQAFFIFVKGFS